MAYETKEGYGASNLEKGKIVVMFPVTLQYHGELLQANNFGPEVINDYLI